MLDDYQPRTYSDLRSTKADLRKRQEKNKTYQEEQNDWKLERIKHECHDANTNNDKNKKDVKLDNLIMEYENAVRRGNTVTANNIKKLLVSYGNIDGEWEKYGTISGRNITQMHHQTASNVMVAKELNIFEALRKLANEKHLLVINTLNAKDQNEFTLKELRTITGLRTNDLNHSLTALREVDIVIKRGNKYILTNYGHILIQGIKDINSKIMRRKSILFSPIEPRMMDLSGPFM